jgi:hypothetical protein
MSPQNLSTLRRLEGHHVAVRLSDGTHIPDCELVSAARRGGPTLWLLEGDTDRFVRLADVTELWETA